MPTNRPTSFFTKEGNMLAAAAIKAGLLPDYSPDQEKADEILRLHNEDDTPPEATEEAVEAPETGDTPEEALEVEESVPALYASIAKLSPDDLAAVLAGNRFGIYQSGGTVTKRVEGGVYCQFNREGHDGSVHVNVVIPETFVLETFVAPAEPDE